MTAIDWSAPIEAVHEDGRVVAATLMSLPQPMKRAVVSWQICGQGAFVENTGETPFANWTIRNVRQPEASLGIPRDLPPEVVERMKRVVRGYVAGSTACDFGPSGDMSLYADSCALTKLLPPEPIDPDIEEAKRIAAGMIYSNDPDATEKRVHRLALAAIRRGRDLARQDAGRVG